MLIVAASLSSISAALPDSPSQATSAAHRDPVGTTTPPANKTDGSDPTANFFSPPDSAAPHTWWHWMNGNVTREGITADLESMKRVGIRSATIVTAGISIPDGPAKYLSPEWLAMLKFAAQEADRLGLKIGMGNCAGWSSSGGPWITPESSMQMIVSSEQQVAGPVHFSSPLPQPETRLDFYRDLKVVAFPTLDGEGETIAANPPVFSGSAPGFDGAKMMNGTGSVLPVPVSGKPQYIQVKFSQPFEARTLTFSTGASAVGGGIGEIQSSDDGQNFQTLEQINLQFLGQPVSYAIPPVSARFYRLVFRRVPDLLTQLPNLKVEFSATVRIPDYRAKTLYGASSDYVKNVPVISSVPESMIVHPEKTVDLTGLLGQDGKLDWTVPPGKWTILRFGYTTTGETNHPAAKEGVGLECDKMSRVAAKQYWDGIIPKITQDLGPLMGKTFDHVLIDSYEVGGQNWTPNFREEFQKRCGYDLLTFLPVFTGRYVEGQEQSTRFLWDLRRTIGALFAENYYDYFDILAHQAGLKLNIEPYDGPYESLRCGRNADRVMGEFWWPDGNDFSLKIASSIAHTYGKQIAGAEAFTSFHGGWDMSPQTMKSLGDLAFARGINSYDFHRFTHQPWPNRNPGMTMGPWGSNLDRTNTWWEQGGAWMTYLKRCDYLLQQGLYVADLLYFDGLDVPSRVPTPALSPGYDYDGCDENVILHRLSVQDGRLMLPDGMSYRALVLPATDKITPELLNKIQELANAGATIIGPKPIASPSLAAYPTCDQEVQHVAARLWSDEKIVSDPPEQVLASLGVKPDFQTELTDQPLYIHRTFGGTDAYFLSNQKKVDEEVNGIFRVTGKAPELWHPDTGLIEKMTVFTDDGERTHLAVHLDPVGSVFVVFRPTTQATDHATSVTRSGIDAPPLYADSLVIKHAVFHSRSGAGSADVTAKVADLIKNGSLHIKVGTDLLGEDPAPNEKKELRIDYILNGQDKMETAPEAERIDIASSEAGFPTCALHAGGKGQLSLEAWKTGTYEIRMAAGKTMRKDVSAALQPVEVGGPWNLQFPPDWGAPPQVNLQKLVSWTAVPDLGVKYFSGTATYHKKLQIPAGMAGAGRHLYLDLGDVQVIAQIKLNGRNLGVLWKPPFRVEITPAARVGENDLEVQVTNLWPNRIIGDQQLPEDCEWNKDNSLKVWPQWLLAGKPSPAGRFTFATWRQYGKGAALVPSGLIGPVTLLPAIEIALP